jgi:pyridoxamine 5'-phosphate oxidase
MVLVKGAAETGFVFHTNRDSAKGRELAANPFAALVFHWDPRSVRVAGRVEAISDAESDGYWAGRPRGSQLGAWASAQSTVIGDRAALEARLADVTDRFAGGDVPRPPFWGGYRIVPSTVEFWHHRDDRLHDRVRYRREGDAWVRERLSP